MHLHTHRDGSALPFWPFPEFFPTYVSAHDLADYYAGFSRLLGPHLQLRTTVASVRRVDVELPSGVLLASHVRTLQLLCADDAGGPWRNASDAHAPHVGANVSADGTLAVASPGVDSFPAANLTLRAACDARFWRLALSTHTDLVVRRWLSVLITVYSRAHADR